MLTFFDYSLSARLQAVADRVAAGSIVADIGTDHAYLPLYLVKSGRCPRVVAVEVAPGPYQRAVAAVRAADLADRIEVRYGDGLQALQPGEAGTVVMAGLGSLTQQAILAARPQVRQKLEYLVLQPQGKVEPLRRWLAAAGWCLVDEELVFEEGHYYFILVARQGKSPAYSDIEWQLGPLLLKHRHPLLAGYLRRKMEKLAIAIDQMASSQKAAARLQREQFITKLKEIQEVLSWLQNVPRLSQQ
ncbi:MAG: SAM-dependent methyltransferase [Clostridia bacterium]|nr:SAM-dependent methyltransferase [Clostridia bacterium]